MADTAEKTKKVLVRLTRDFPQGQQHTRGGVTLGAGPRPVEVEVTSDQLDALKGDRYVEIVDKKEAKKWEERLGAAPAPTSSDLADDSAGDENGRTYDDEGNDSSDDGSEGSDNDSDKPVEVNTDMSIKDLAKIATDEEVEGAENFTKPGTSKQTIIDAIEAKRAEASDKE